MITSKPSWQEVDWPNMSLDCFLSLDCQLNFKFTQKIDLCMCELSLDMSQCPNVWSFELLKDIYQYIFLPPRQCEQYI